MRFSPYAWTKADLVGGDLSLDFVNTASAWASGDPIDRLGGAGGLADWAVVTGLAEPHDTAALKAACDQEPAKAAALFDEATTLRALLWRLFTAAAQGGRALPQDLAALHDWICRARAARELRQTRDGFREGFRDGVPPGEKLLLSIALAAGRLLTEGPLDRLRACGGADCEWMFLDLSKNGSRRWCSMATCGNAAKVKKFRTRKTGAGQ